MNVTIEWTVPLISHTKLPLGDLPDMKLCFAVWEDDDGFDWNLVEAYVILGKNITGPRIDKETDLHLWQIIKRGVEAQNNNITDALVAELYVNAPIEGRKEC